MLIAFPILYSKRIKISHSSFFSALSFLFLLKDSLCGGVGCEQIDWSYALLLCIGFLLNARNHKIHTHSYPFIASSQIHCCLFSSLASVICHCLSYICCCLFVSLHQDSNVRCDIFASNIVNFETKKKLSVCKNGKITQKRNLIRNIQFRGSKSETELKIMVIVYRSVWLLNGWFFVCA